MTREFVDVFADVVCPFTHVGLRRFVARRGEVGMTVPLLRVRAWPLELVNGQPFDPDAVAHHVHELRRQVAPDLFARFTPEAVPTTSMPAFALVAEAYAVGDALGEAVSLAVRSALFEDGRAAHGIGGVSIAAEQMVASDYNEGRRRGVQGSPEFFLDGRSYFCPGLRMDRSGNEMVIEPDVTRFDAFLVDCLAA